MPKTRLSIVISTFNCARSLQACLDSIFAQTYPEIQIVIADGGSTDGTVAVIEANADRIDAWKSAPDRGIYDAWNSALSMVSGDWVYFIGADDTLHAPDTVARVIEKLDAVPEETLVAYARFLFLLGNGRKVPMGRPWSEARRRIHAEMTIPHPATFHRHALFEEVGPFDADLRIAGDYKMILQSLRIAEPCFLGDILICEKQAGGVSELRRNRLEVLLEARRVQAEQGYRVSPIWVIGLAKGAVWFLLARLRSAFSLPSDRGGARRAS